MEPRISVVNQMRFYVAQLYIPPRVFDSRKFHLRVYVLAVGPLYLGFIFQTLGCHICLPVV